MVCNPASTTWTPHVLITNLQPIQVIPWEATDRWHSPLCLMD